MPRAVGRDSIRKDPGAARRGRASIRQCELDRRAGALARHLRLYRSDAGSVAARVGRFDRPATGQSFNRGDPGIDAHGRRSEPVGCANRASLRRSVSRSRLCRAIGSLLPISRSSEERPCYRVFSVVCRDMRKPASCARSRIVCCSCRRRSLDLVALTANVRDYDVLLQLIPAGRALCYPAEVTPTLDAVPAQGRITSVPANRWQKISSPVGCWHTRPSSGCGARTQRRKERADHDQPSDCG